VAAWLPYMFCKFDLVKNCKIANNRIATFTLERTSTYLISLEFYEKIVVRLTKFKNNQILNNKIGHQFFATTKLLIGSNTTIERTFRM
jgi:hypothetical protein